MGELFGALMPPHRFKSTLAALGRVLGNRGAFDSTLKGD